MFVENNAIRYGEIYDFLSQVRIERAAGVGKIVIGSGMSATKWEFSVNHLCLWRCTWGSAPWTGANLTKVLTELYCHVYGNPPQGSQEYDIIGAFACQTIARGQMPQITLDCTQDTFTPYGRAPKDAT